MSVSLVMTGQSVNQCDLKALRDEYVMGVNFMMLHKDFRSSDCILCLARLMEYFH